MSTTTDRLLLVKPDELEFVDIDIINANYDKINKNFIPAAKLRSTVDVALAANTINGVVNFNDIDFDSMAARTEGPIASTATDRLTCRKTGLWYLGAQANISYNASFTQGYRALSIYKNNSVIVCRDARDSNKTNSLYTTLDCSDVVYAVAGDYWDCRITNTSGGSSTVDAGWLDATSFSAVWLGSIV